MTYSKSERRGPSGQRPCAQHGDGVACGAQRIYSLHSPDEPAYLVGHAIYFNGSSVPNVVGADDPPSGDDKGAAGQKLAIGNRDMHDAAAARSGYRRSGGTVNCLHCRAHTELRRAVPQTEAYTSTPAGKAVQSHHVRAHAYVQTRMYFCGRSINLA